MSEHKLNTARYWARSEPESQDTVYFVTESNAAHSRAEGDIHALEVTKDFYESHVPEEARGAPFPPNAATAVNGSNANHSIESGIIEKYRAACVGNMIGVHQNIIKLLMGSDITHAERVFVLEMVKHELLASMMQPAQPAAANDQVH